MRSSFTGRSTRRTAGAAVRRRPLLVEPLESRRMLAAWPVRVGGGGTQDSAFDVVTLADGSALVTGCFGPTATFGGTTLTSAGSTDVFIAKLKLDGSLAWATRAGGASGDAGYALDAFPDGSSLVAGNFDETSTFGATTLTSAGSADIFIAKLNANGTFAWAKKAGGPGYDSVHDVVVSRSGDGSALISGLAGAGGATFDSFQVPANFGFIAKLKADGSYAWVQKLGVAVYGMAALADGATLITGGFGATQTFGDTTLSSTGSWDVVVARLNADGTFAWATRAGWTGLDVGHGISVTADGGAFVTGSYEGTATFGGTTLANSGGSDVFVARVNPTGSFAWAKRAGGADQDIGRAIVTTADGAAVLTGNFRDTATFGGTTLTSLGDDDVFVTKVTPNGSFAWARRAGGPGLDQGLAIAARSAGSTLVAGRCRLPAAFGGTMFPTSPVANDGDVFVAKVTPSGEIESAPDAPTNVKGVGGFGEVTLTWTAPQTNGLEVTAYRIEYRSTNQRIPTWSLFPNGTSAATTTKVTGLKTDGTQYLFRVSATNASGTGASSTDSAPVVANNNPPTAVGLSQATVAENLPMGTLVGTLSTADPDPGDTFTYVVVNDKALNGSGRFTIVGNELRTKEAFDFEKTATYSVRVRSLDKGGLFVGKVFTITVTNANDAPTGIALSPATVAENQPVGTVVGALSSTDPDPGDTFKYVIVPDPNLDGTLFEIVGNQLRTKAAFDFEAKKSYSVRVRTVDQGGGTFGKVLTVGVTNVNESPTAVLLSSTTVAEQQPVGTVVATLSTNDPDAGDTFTYVLVGDPLVDGTPFFQIVGNQLRTKAVFNAAVKSSYTIRIRTIDQGSLFFGKVFTITIGKQS